MTTTPEGLQSKLHELEYTSRNLLVGPSMLTQEEAAWNSRPPDIERFDEICDGHEIKPLESLSPGFNACSLPNYDHTLENDVDAHNAQSLKLGDV